MARSGIAGGRTVIHVTDIAARLGLRRYLRSWRGGGPYCDCAAGTFSVCEGKAGHARLYCTNGGDHDILLVILDPLDEYRRRLTLELVRGAGGDCLPRMPLRAVPR
jgi:hypothetical protein